MCREITKASCIAGLPLKPAFLRHAFRFPHSPYSHHSLFSLFSFSGRMLGIRRDLSEAKWRALSAAKGEQEEDNIGRFQIEFRLSPGLREC